METIEVFKKYGDNNKDVLNTIGVIATITALFLNLNPSVFGESLRSLQLLLLLFLILGLLLLTINSLFWFKNNADSFFAGLIVFSMALLSWKVLDFTLNNFRTELNQYLSTISVSFSLLIGSYLTNLRLKAESKINKGLTNALPKALIAGLFSFLFLYSFNVSLNIYSEFIKEKEITSSLLMTPFSGTLIWELAIWSAVIEFCVSFFFTKERSRLWLNIMLISLLTITLLAIIWGM